MKSKKEFYKAIGVKILKMQIALEVNDTQLGKLTGKSRQRIGQIKRSLWHGKGVQPGTLHTIARGLGVDVQDFFE